MLRITKVTDYGVVIMTHFAQRPHEAVLTAKDIAHETHVPLPMVSKILKILTKNGLLASHRGVKGGYALPRPAKDINLAEIVFALDGPIAMTECSDDDHAGDCRIEESCRVRVNWQRITTEVKNALSKINLAEMGEPGCAGHGCGTEILMMPGSHARTIEV